MVKKFISGSIDYENKEKIILRDYLALERTRLANERTLFSYIRTSLYLLIGGITMLQLEGFGSIRWIGELSIGLCIVIMAFGLIRFHQMRNKLRKYYSNPEGLADE
jgi:putative membrane protein